MNLKLIIHTLRHLQLRQVCYQVRYRLQKPKFVAYRVTTDVVRCNVTKGVDRYICCEGEKLNFLNITDDFRGWADTSKGMLWAYNLNYMDWLNQPNMPYEIGARWIDDFINNLPSNSVGQDPYPIALRAINWIKFITKYWGDIPTAKRIEWCNSLYSQYRLLIKKLEYHLLANHLLEDVFSLFIGAIFFADAKMYRRAERVLRQELDEQILQDGAHYEQSVMYHSILLDRLLDCYNFASNNLRFDGQYEVVDFLRKKAELMLGHLEAIRYSDGAFPMFNDAALGIAPAITDLFEYANRLNISWRRVDLSDSGYRRLSNNFFEVIVDVGNITATYQPGHSHADALNYELRIDGRPIIVDTGISTYDKNSRRQYERSTIAHNCVSIDNGNSDEVWGGFRVGSRCKTSILRSETNLIEAYHDGFEKKCYRTFLLKDNSFCVEDQYEGDACSYVHLAHGIDPELLSIEGANRIEIYDTKYSVEYNRFLDNKTIVIHFNGICRYSINNNC